ncbi:MAG: 3-hydroxylacyl-ACP dehydratase [Bacteroidales bacterium]|jgi:3-hydroxyacyl-[acyl-carrier-protein] dehydratase
MLLKDFYTLVDRTGPAEEISASGGHSERYRFRINLNPSHPVYEGHFSGNPVVPGVCQIQMIKELFCLIKGREMLLKQAENIKFLSLMVPIANSIINADITLRETEDGGVQVNATLIDGEIVFIKFKGLFINE